MFGLGVKIFRMVDLQETVLGRTSPEQSAPHSFYLKIKNKPFTPLMLHIVYAPWQLYLVCLFLVPVVFNYHGNGTFTCHSG